MLTSKTRLQMSHKDIKYLDDKTNEFFLVDIGGGELSECAVSKGSGWTITNPNNRKLDIDSILISYEDLKRIIK